MATKKFKKLPKDSQRAAFAQMDKDGTRQDRGGKGGGSFLPRETIGGYKITLAPSDTQVRVVSPSGQIGIVKRAGRSNQEIIKSMKSANKNFK
jgi:hypothetical protein